MKLEDFYKEAIEIFTNLLRFNTTNPPGNEIKAALYLKEIFSKEGFEPILLESAPGRGNLIVRYKGVKDNGTPLLLSSHLDVVEAYEEGWIYPPFGGVVADGYIWGRGAVDMKHMTVMELMTLLIMKRRGILPKRDIIFAAVADEENGGEFGAGWLVKHHPDLIWAEYALNEVGGFTQYIGGKRFYPVQVAEKGYCWLKIRVTGESGHGSLPHKNNALVKLSQVIGKIGKATLPYHKNRTTEKFIETLAKYQPFPNSLILKGLLNPRLCDFILENIFPDKNLANTFLALFHNTANPTILHSGSKVNVIPSHAEAEVDGRILPGQSEKDFLKELKKLVDERLEWYITKSGPPIEVSYSTPLFQKIKENLIKHDPEGIVIPYMSSGFTDAKHYSKLGTICYGFTPMKLPLDLSFSRLFHGCNERIPVDAFLFGMELMYDLVVDFCS